MIISFFLFAGAQKTLTTPMRYDYKRDMETLNIKQIREEHNLTQEALAAVIGVTHSTIYRWERGTQKPQGPARKALEKMQRNRL